MTLSRTFNPTLRRLRFVDLLSRWLRMVSTGLLIALPSAASALSATGGNTTNDIDGFRIHTFTQSGLFTISASGKVDVLVVAGGGGGGGYIGGGGGGGGVIYTTAFPVATGSIPITVGAGGAAGANAGYTGFGGPGSNSVFSTLIAIGGGRGGAAYVHNNIGSGGSGGGAGGSLADVTEWGQSGTAGQGHDGGHSSATQNYGAGGGGGAGAPGENGTNTKGGDGGDGVTNSMSGSDVLYGGGGGGGKYFGTSGGLGGTGGGGNAGNPGMTGTTNTGGGGGGGGLNPVAAGGTGGSGIVRIRYALANDLVVTAWGASPIGETTATLNGGLTGDGGISNTRVAFCWGTVDVGTDSTSIWPHVIDLGTNWGKGAIFSTNIMGLLSGSNYAYRCYATNSTGADWSDPATPFMTIDLTPYEEWSHSCTLQIPAYDRTEALTGFPLLVAINEARLSGFSYQQFGSISNGADLRFTDITGVTTLWHEVDEWDPTGTSYVWVRVPALTTGLAIRAWWGNPNAAAPPYSTNGAVWSNGCLAVWHMTEPNALDSTGAGRHGTAHGNANAPGRIGLAQSFAAASANYISTADIDTPYVTLSAWVNASLSTLNKGYVINKNYDGSSSVNYSLNIGGSGYPAAVDGLSFFNGAWRHSGLATDVRGTGWRHVAGTYDGTWLRFYVDGKLNVSSTEGSGPLPSNNQITDIGRYASAPGGSACFDGLIDEARIDSVARSSNWIWAAWLNQASNTVFVAFTNLQGAFMSNLIEDSFAGSTINADLWIEHDSDAQVSQNDGLFMSTGTASWTNCGLESVASFRRSAGLRIESVARVSTSNTRSIPIGYGDWDPTNNGLFLAFDSNGRFSTWVGTTGSVDSGVTYTTGTWYRLTMELTATHATYAAFRDGNGDGDFTDSGENTDLLATASGRYRVTGSGDLKKVRINNVNADLLELSRIRAWVPANTTALRVDIAAAQSLHNSTVEGSQPGEFPPGSKAGLQTAISNAIVAADNYYAIQADANQAQADLAAAVAVFGATVIHGPLHHILGTGQSLSVGWAGFPPLSVFQPYQNLMLSGQSQDGTNLVSLIEIGNQHGSQVETISSGLANTLTALSPNQYYQSIVTRHGDGAKVYAELKKGTAYFAWGMTQVARARTAALGLGRQYVVPAVTVIHGESDHVANNGALYEGYLREWQADYEADVKALTGQTNAVLMFLCQMSSHTGYGHSVPRIAGPQLSACENSVKHILVGPKYFLTYVDAAHLNAASYRHLGEYYGKALKKTLVDGTKWEPLKPFRIRFTNNTITLDLKVPVPPIVIDTNRVILRNNYGFEYTDDLASASIVSVSVVDSDSVRIVLNQVPTGANPRLRYAWTGTPNSQPGWNMPGSARGNLRDNDATPSLYGNPLFNWLVHFNYPIPYGPDPEPEPVPSIPENATVILVQ
jgi:hypothetical protein